MTLSVVLINYNYGQYVAQAAQSILNQNYRDIEFLIIDDASTDNSIEEIHRVIRGHKKVQFIQHKKNRGIHFTLNEAVKLLKGKYLYTAASDDCVLPGFFEKAMSAFQKNPELGLCSSDPLFFQNGEDPLLKRKSVKDTQLQVYQPEDSIKLFREKNFWLAGHSTIYRMDLVRKYGVAKLELYHLCDWYFQHQIALNYPIGFIPENLAAMRCHSQSFSSVAIRSKQAQKSAFAGLLDLLKKDPEKDKWKQSCLLYQLKYPLGFFVLKNPKYWSFLPHLMNRFVRKKILKLLKKI